MYVSHNNNHVVTHTWAGIARYSFLESVPSLWPRVLVCRAKWQPVSGPLTSAVDGDPVVWAHRAELRCGGSRNASLWRNIRESCSAANCMRVEPVLAFIMCPLDIRECGSQLLAFRSQTDWQWLPMVGTEIQTSGISSCLALKNKTTPGGNQPLPHAGQKKAKLKKLIRGLGNREDGLRNGESHPFGGMVSLPPD